MAFSGRGTAPRPARPTWEACQKPNGARYSPVRCKALLGGGLRLREVLVEELPEELVGCVVGGQEVVAHPVVPSGVDSQTTSPVVGEDCVVGDGRYVDAPSIEEVPKHQESADIPGTPLHSVWIHVWPLAATDTSIGST